VSAVQNVKVQGADFVNNVTSNRLQIIGVACVARQAIRSITDRVSDTSQVDRQASSQARALILSVMERSVCVMPP